MIRTLLLAAAVLTASVLGAQAQNFAPFPSRPNPVPVPAVQPPTGAFNTTGIPITQPPLIQQQTQTFGDRVNQCIQTAAGAGLSPNDVTTYTRQCASSP
jgi:hypothetical protein